jgi:hypothetical protein
MQEAPASGKRRVVGWEGNGGFLIGSQMTLNDGLLPILAVLYPAAEQDSATNPRIRRR